MVQSFLIQKCKTPDKIFFEVNSNIEINDANTVCNVELVERETKEKLIFPLEREAAAFKSNGLSYFGLDMNYFSNIIFRGEVWDAFIIHTSSVRHTKNRLTYRVGMKQHYYYNEYFNKYFIPYQTKNGSLSFFISEDEPYRDPILELCTIKGELLKLRISVDSKHMNPATHFNLKMVNSNRKKELTIPLKKINKPFSVLQAEMNLFAYNPLIVESSRWDYYITIHSSDGYEEIRLKTLEESVKFTYKLSGNKNFIITPHITIYGNFSLKVYKNHLKNKVTNLYLKQNGRLIIGGELTHQLWSNQTSEKKVTIVLQGANFNEYRYPIESVEEDDILGFGADKGVLSFFTEIDLVEVLSESMVESSNILIEVDFCVDGESLSLITPPLKFRKKLTQSYKVNRPTKNISLSVAVPNKNGQISIKYEKTYPMYKLRIKWDNLKSKFINTKMRKKIMQLFAKLPVKSNFIVFESFAGKQYSCNPRAIYEYMKWNKKEFKMYWSVDPAFQKSFESRDLNVVRRFSLKWLYLMARSRYWVTNSRIPLWVIKPKHTIYLQTWHGTPLKKLATDMKEVHMPGTSTKKYKRNFLKEARRWDYLISPNRYSTGIFSRAFDFNKVMLETGYPRNDYLIENNKLEEIEKLKIKLGLPIDKKVILYAPTWRDNQFYEKGKYKFTLDLNIDKLKETFNDEYIIILRMHYLISENFNLNQYEGFAFDFSDYEDIRDLYLISDVLITDYSSVFFDYANLKRPIIFYTHDIEMYRDNLRGFYFDFEKSTPGPLVKTTEEVIDTLININQTNIEETSSFIPFYNYFCYLEDGRATQRVVDQVFGKGK